MKEKLGEPETETKVLDYVSTFNERLLKARQIAQENLGRSQASMKTCKTRYDMKGRQGIDPSSNSK